MSFIKENHKIGDSYSLTNMNGVKDYGWKVAYYPLTGTYKNGIWQDFKENRVLVEKNINNGIDFREIPIHFLNKESK
jgi:hypothetical protein